MEVDGMAPWKTILVVYFYFHVSSRESTYLANTVAYTVAATI